MLISIFFTLYSAFISIFDNSPLFDAFGSTFVVLVLVLIPGFLLSELLFHFNQPIKSTVIGSSFILATIIPLHALLSKLSLSIILVFVLILLDVFLIFKYLKNKKFEIKFIYKLDYEKYVLMILFIIISILLFRQSLHVPANNLDQFLIWPDTYNALAQAAEITNHGPTIFPFVADALVPLKYHWGAFSLGSFISLFGNFELIVSIHKTQFILLGFLFFGILFFASKEFAKSWYAGVFAVILGVFTIYPNFPEFNEQIGLARPFISSNSMPQFTANLFAILGIYLVLVLRNSINNKLSFILIFLTTLTATLSKGPVGLLIFLMILALIFVNLKIDLKNNLIYLLLPSLLGFMIGYSQITSSNSQAGKSGTSLWLNPFDTFKLLTESYGIELNFQSILVFSTLFLLSFSYLLFAFLYSLKTKSLKTFFPLILTCLAGVMGTILLEAWGNSQLFLLYSVIPFIAVLLSNLIFKDKKIDLNILFFVLLGLVLQPLLFSLLSSFVARSFVLRTFIIWIIATVLVFLISILLSKINGNSIIFGLLITSSSIGLFSGLTKFDPIAYSLPEHPYSITVGTYEIGKYLRKNSNKSDILATNRHCAGPEENQTCTARQFALSALAERRVFIEGWSYTTCALSDPILNSYWKEDSWKANQDFFINPTQETWNDFKQSQVRWLVVDTTRPSASSYQEFADLVKTSGQMQLWKIKNPELNSNNASFDSCSSDSVLQNK